jgi:hypothetical protein
MVSYLWVVEAKQLGPSQQITEICATALPADGEQ